jgi:hypothetical protein
MRFLTGVWFHLGHALRAHPWMRLLLGAVVVFAGVLSVFVGVGHGGSIAAGCFVIAGAMAAIRSNRVRPEQLTSSPGTSLEAEEPRP